MQMVQTNPAGPRGSTDGTGAIDVVPYPRHVAMRPGTFPLGRRARLVAEGEAREAAWLLHDLLRPATGLPLPVVGEDSGPAHGPGAVALRISPSPGAHPEGYRLEIGRERAELTAATPAGLARAVQTFRQLLPADALRAAPVANLPLTAPCCVIEDEPRFAWRGVMLDVARHFMPKDFVLRLIDLAALHRLNTLHLHLTDDQGWRVEVPSRPRLTEVGSWRRETAHGPAARPTRYDATPHGGFYTLAELREIVAHAARRHITVVPEIGLPGHVQAALAACPELGMGEGPYEVRTGFGPSSHALAPYAETVRFLTDVLDVVTDVFPSPYVHIGGDECPKQEWRASARAREFAAELGLPSVDALQSHLLRRAAAHLERRGRRAAAWDQAMEDGGVPRETVVMAWRDFAEGDVAAQVLRAGHDLVHCPTRTTYLDHPQSEHPDEPVGFPEVTSLDDVVAFDPAPEHLLALAAESRSGRVLGTQAQLWTEHLTTPQQVEYVAFPRLGALAEAAWTPMDQRRAHPFGARLPGHLARLDALSVNYRPPAGPHPWQCAGRGDRARGPAL